MTIIKTSQAEWDRRWLGLAMYVATRFSKDPSTQVGAVFVSPDGREVSLGYNGFPSRMPDHPEHLHDRDEKYPRTVHAEINARDAMSKRPVGWTLYTWPFLTCDRCAVQMIQAGIARAVAPICPPDQLSRWGDTLERARGYYDECSVIHDEIEFDPASVNL